MKKTIFLVASIFSTVALMAQAVLPTNWDSSGNPPTGWMISGTTTYTGSGNPLPAVRFDTQGDYIQIEFAESPGLLTYDITGNPPTGQQWAGLLEIQESVDGVNFTQLRAITNLAAGTYGGMSDTPAATSRFIRFNFTTKTTGNVGLDNVNIALPVAGPEQEIDIANGIDRIPSNGTAYVSAAVGSSAPLTLTISNEGLVNPLNIGNAVITGADAASFAVTTVPTTINASSQDNLIITFSPTVSGTHNAVLSIDNNDSDEAPYIINLYGVGGTLATEPTTQAANLNFTNIKSYRYTVNLTQTNADGVIVLRKTGSAVTDLPVDGVSYGIGDGIGSSKVAYVGSGSSFVPNYILAGTTDHFAVFTYNGPSTFVNYLTSAPLTGSVTTLSTMVSPTEYSALNTSSPSFPADLQAIVSPHTRILYGDYSRTIIEGFYERDTTNGQKVVNCAYTSFPHIYTPPMDFSVISREHSIPQSWMLTVASATFEDQKEYSDYHNLFPVHQDDANAVRSNNPLGIVVNATNVSGDGKFGTNANGQTVYEPRDEQKGAAARAMFYMMLTYNGVSGNWGLDNLLSDAQFQNQDLLREWHYNFPPSALEIGRNDYLDSLQGNRNPFIDNPDYVCYIDFYNVSKINLTSPCSDGPESSASINELDLSSNFLVYPNPASTKLNLSLKETEINSYVITDVLGRVITEKTDLNSKNILVDLSEFNKGSYIIFANTVLGTAKSTFIVSK
jgi:hypothetical protein